MGPPSTPALTSNPVESPDKYIEPLADEDPPAVSTSGITGASLEYQAAMVYEQLLELGERQKYITGKYRTVADDIRRKVEAEKKAEAEKKVEAEKKEIEDIDMGGQ